MISTNMEDIMGKRKYVITMTRQFGSMGRPIAKKMAEKLGIEYYDRDIVDQAAKNWICRYL